MSYTKKSILEMARGAILERVDYDTSRILANIQDPNTSATAKRKLTITVEWRADDERQNIQVRTIAKATLAPTNPVVTSLYVADGESVVEMVPQLPGQVAMDGGEQEPPAMLKIINFS